MLILAAVLSFTHSLGVHLLVRPGSSVDIVTLHSDRPASLGWPLSFKQLV